MATLVRSLIAAVIAEASALMSAAVIDIGWHSPATIAPGVRSTLSSHPDTG
jgi:hypothetical protein